ncbi:WxL domain-containing protein [Enterococcus sp. AZ126]|uniref:WxL domain-containing protein n=1 Tax=Enterococcus sp. AZ126 TaxID=2774635 RepID=UPI003F2951F5
MKTKTLCSVALLTLVGVSLAAPAAANAEAKSLPSNGKIKFTEDNSEKPIVDPEDPDKPVVDPKEPVIVNPDRGSFSIDAVTELNFGEDKVKAFASNPEYFAAAIPVTTGTGEDATEVNRGNFVQFTDVRGVANHKYKVSAQLSKQFEANANAGTFLKGATIGYSNAKISSADPAAQWPATTVAGFTLAADAAGTGAGSSVDVLTNTDASKGIGTYTIEFGQYGDGTADTTAESVKLTVPNTNVLLADEYTAEITWTIAEVL